MNTSGSGPAALLLATASAARSVLGDLGHRLRRPPRGAVGLWLVVAVPSVLGLAVPVVYASTVALLVVRRRSSGVLVAGAVVLAAGIALLLLRDAHGESVVADLLVGPFVGAARHAALGSE